MRELQLSEVQAVDGGSLLDTLGMAWDAGVSVGSQIAAFFKSLF
ncbi:hypothetical protein [Rheinheimera pleomorphica]|nr:hypothetical protein [Rheinheimera pleomorphica]